MTALRRIGITLALENIPAPLGGAEKIAEMVERIDHPCLKVCLDSGHAYLTEGEGAGAAFRRLAPMAAATHLHDNDGESDGHLIPGEGKMPFPALWVALEEASYEGPLTFELGLRESGSYADLLSELGRAAPIPGVALRRLSPTARRQPHPNDHQRLLEDRVHVLSHERRSAA